MRMCTLLGTALILTFALMIEARTQSIPTLWVTMNGSCKLLMLAGKVVECREASLMYQQFDNGRASFSVAIRKPTFTLIAFSGDQVLRPKPGELRLKLDRILHTPGAIVVPVRGECIYKGDMSQAVQQELRCATTEQAAHQLLFVTDGKKPAEILRF